MKILLYIFLVIFICVLIKVVIFIYYNTKNYNEIKYIIDKTNSIDFYTNIGNYRLGDGFYYTEDESKWNIDKKNDINSYHYKPLKYFVDNYPDSILSEYLLKSNYKQKKYDILLDILNNRFIKDKTINKFNSVLLHIRLGDVIDKNCKDKCFIKKFYYNYDSYIQQDEKNLFNILKIFKSSKFIKYYKYYSYIAKKLKKLGIINIYIICGSHIKLNDYKYSTYYLKEIIKIFEDYGFKIYTNIGKSPDEDLLFSMNFNYFVPSYGQYSSIISDVNKKNNKKFNIIN